MDIKVIPLNNVGRYGWAIRSAVENSDACRPPRETESVP